MKTINQFKNIYNTEIKLAKAMFFLSACFFLLSFFFHKNNLGITNPNNIMNAVFNSDEKLFFSFIFIPLFTIFYTPKDYIKKWVCYIIISAILACFNLFRSNEGIDFFMMGKYPVTLYIYILTFILLNIFIIKDKLKSTK